MTLWRDAVAHSRSAVSEALADGGMDHLATGISNSAVRHPACGGC